MPKAIRGSALASVALLSTAASVLPLGCTHAPSPRGPACAPPSPNARGPVPVSFRAHWRQDHRFLKSASLRLTRLVPEGRESLDEPLPGELAFRSEVTGPTVHRSLPALPGTWAAGDGLRMDLSFTPPGAKHPVLSVSHSWVLAQEGGCADVLRWRSVPGSSPLVADNRGADEAPTAISVEVDTRWVDATEIWARKARGSFYHENIAARQLTPDQPALWEEVDPKWRHLRVLVQTRDAPEVWFAYVPDALQAQTPAARVSRLVFYKFNEFHYWQVSTAFPNPRLGMFLVNQYLLEPRPLTAAETNDPSLYVSLMNVSDRWRIQNGRRINWLRSGMASSIERSGMPILLLLPWRESGRADASVKPGLDVLTADIARFLAASGHLRAADDAIEKGRFGLAGFSGGGGTALQAFTANAAHVSELYLLDAISSPKFRESQDALIKRWFVERPGVNLRIVCSAFSCQRWWELASSLEASAAAGSWVAVHDLDQHPFPWLSYQMQRPGGPLPPQSALSSLIKHQFATSGGFGSPEGGEQGRPRRFLSEFLSLSGF